MKKSLHRIFPVWLCCILFPLPAVALWHSDDGRRIALGLFFIGCTNLVAYTFRQEADQEIVGGGEHPIQIWRSRMWTLTVALIAAFGIFSLLLLILSDIRDLIAVVLALFILVPALGVTPHFTLLTQRPVAAVVFTLCSVFCMKLLGCVVVVLVYGWHADAHGYTDMQWTHPNLLVWLFWFFTAILSLSLYALGARRFCRVYGGSTKIA